MSFKLITLFVVNLAGLLEIFLISIFVLNFLGDIEWSLFILESLLPLLVIFSFIELYCTLLGGNSLLIMIFL